MKNYTKFLDRFNGTRIEPHRENLTKVIKDALSAVNNSNFPEMKHWLDNLPYYQPESFNLNASSIRIGYAKQINNEERQELANSLKKFHPWRKGPFTIFGIQIDTEWRSDLKWNRLANHILPLKGKNVLDVGCGNGYHCWRIAGLGAENVLGLEPYLLSVMQFNVINKYINIDSVDILPLGIEQFPENSQSFDSVFSMGVLYHRRSPMDHLLELRGHLRDGGELVLETLVIDGEKGKVLVPEDRYAKMRNVWFIPSVLTLEFWLTKCKYEDIRVIDITKTTIEEQRTTEWMQYESLPQFLNPKNNNLTIEGYPAPQRAIFLARAP